MDFALSEGQNRLKTSVREFLEKECPEAVVRKIETDQQGYSPEIWKKISDLGWLGIGIPKEYGGTGGDFIDLMVLHEEMGRALFPSPHLSTVVLCGQTILNAGSPEQKKELLPKIVDGSLILAMALNEPESVWDGRAWEPEGVKMKATPNGNDFILDGVKLFVHDAHVADYILCAARTRQARKSEEGITLFLVPAKSKGVSYELMDTVTNSNKQCEVVFKKVRVSKKNIVGKLNKGWDPLFQSIQAGAVMLCAEMAGAAKKVQDITVDHAKTRIQFDMPIGINQHVQEHCVQLTIRQDACRYISNYAAWALNQPDHELDVAMAKAFCSEAFEHLCWRAHQVLAGVGTMAVLHILPLYTRWGIIAENYLGDTEFWLEMVALALEKLPPHLKTKGKPMDLWDPKKKQVPAWDIWREFAESL